MNIQIPFGNSTLNVQIPDHFQVDVIEAPNPPAAADPFLEVESALDNLLGNRRWEDCRAAQSVAIAVNDKTRSVPHGKLLPPLMEKIAALGIPDSAVTFYVAVGTHPPMTPDEFPSILPAEILSRYRVVSHDAENDRLLINLGETSRETPVWANRAYAESDFKIVVGNIEPHQFAGFSGGVKSAAVGLAGLKTINHNHTLMTHPDSQIGEYESNPARQDIEEMGEKIFVHLALNAILNHQRQIVKALAGDPRAVMRAGIPLAKQNCQVAVTGAYSLMITSPGGYPKDINLYQAQKGLAHAALVTKPGGTIILAAACPEGTGSLHYEEWMPGKTSYEDIFRSFSTEGFRIGPHKAFQIARDASKVNLVFYSEMETDLAKKLLLNPVLDLQAALDAALADLQPGERVGFLPHASTTIPYIEEQQ